MRSSPAVIPAMITGVSTMVPHPSRPEEEVIEGEQPLFSKRHISSASGSTWTAESWQEGTPPLAFGRSGGEGELENMRLAMAWVVVSTSRAKHVPPGWCVVPSKKTFSNRNIDQMVLRINMWNNGIKRKIAVYCLLVGYILETPGNNAR